MPMRKKPIVAPEAAIPATEEPVKRRGPKVAPCEKPSRYTAAEVEAMDDSTLAHEFTRITAWSALSCTHCKGSRPIEVCWMTSIRRKCMKSGGLYEGMVLPKTCDNQTRSNDKNNKTYNPINGEFYRKVYSGKATEDELRAADQRRRDGLAAVGIEARPHTHKFI